MALREVIRSLIAEIGVEGTEETQEALGAINKAMNQVATAAAAVVGGLVSVAGAATALAVTAGRNQEALEGQALVLGVTAESLTQARFAFEALTGQADLADQALGALRSQLRSIATGNREAAFSLANLGISLRALRDGDAVGVLRDLADRAKASGDNILFAGFMAKTFGDDLAAQLLPVLRQGRGEFLELVQEAEDLGLVMRDDLSRDAQKLSRDWRMLQRTLRALRDELGALLSPVVGKYVERVLDWIKANRELISQKMDEWVQRLSNIFENFGPIIGLVALAVGGLAAAFTALFAAVPLAPLIAIVANFTAMLAPFAALAIILDDIATHFRGGESALGLLIDTLREDFPDLAETIERAAGFVHLLVVALGKLADVLGTVVGLVARLKLRALLETLDGVAGALLSILDRGIIPSIAAQFDQFNESVLGLRTNLAGLLGFMNPTTLMEAFVPGGMPDREGIGTAAENISSSSPGSIARAVTSLLAGPLAAPQFAQAVSGLTTNNNTSNATFNQTFWVQGGEFDQVYDSVARQNAESLRGGRE